MIKSYVKPLLLLGLAAGIAPRALADQPTGPGPHAKETFAVIWERLQNSGFKGKDEGLDWVALKAKHQPEIEGAQDIKVLRKEINELLGDLKASHLALIPSEAMPESGKAAPVGLGEVGLRFALADGKLLVRRVVDDFPAQRAGIRPGWSVEKIGKLDATSVLASMRELDAEGRRHSEVALLMQSIRRVDGIAPGSSVELQLRDTAGKSRTVALTAIASPDLQSFPMPGLPPMALRIGEREISQPDGGCTLYFEYSQWATPVYGRLAQALRGHARCDGVVLDLRGNSGGMITTLMAVGGLFFDKPTSLGTMLMGEGQHLELMSLPRQIADDGQDIHRHSGRLAILVDRASVSCSDIFPAGLQAVGRARIFGTTSAGMALPANAVPLPSGDRLMYPMADFVDPKQRRIEGVGVVPEQVIVPSAQALATGKDPILDAALDWIDSKS